MKRDFNTFPSPNGKTEVRIINENGRLYYEILSGNAVRFRKAALGGGIGKDEKSFENFSCDNELALADKKEIRNRAYSLFGRREKHQENCNYYVLTVKHKTTAFNVEIKVFDDGAAFRYSFSGSDGLFVHNENTEFLLPTKSKVYASFGCRHPGCNTALNGFDALCYECTYDEYDPSVKFKSSAYARKKDYIEKEEHFNYLLFPMVVKYSDGTFGAITEADVRNYLGSSLRPYGKYRFGLNTLAGEKQFKTFEVRDKVLSPWRVFTIANNLDELYNNDIIYSVVERADKDFSFVTPGRATWHWHAELMNGRKLTAEMAEEYTDAAAKMGFEYNVVDADWQRMKKNADGKTLEGKEVLKDLCERGKPYSVGQVVWSGFVNGKNRLNPEDFDEKGSADYSVREMLDICSDVGAAGVKMDFFRSESLMYSGVDMYERVADYCADRKMICNFHGATKPTGLSARYPNELSREGIKGMENYFYSPVSYPAIAYGFSTLTFVRGLAGHGDWTPFVQDGIGLASILLTDSPINVISASARELLEHKAKDFIKSIPASFDKTTVLADSEFGKYVSMCKEKDGAYFFASMNNRKDDYKQVLDLKKYMAKGVYCMELWFDSPEGLRTERRLLQEKDSVEVVVPPYRGFAARFSKLMPSYFGGEVTSPLELNRYNGEDIYYTTDDSDPKSSKSRKLYDMPVKIGKSCYIRACAIKDGAVSSEIRCRYNVMK